MNVFLVNTLRGAETSMVLLGWLWTSGCDSDEQDVRIIAEDFRFTPIEVHVASGQQMPA